VTCISTLLTHSKVLNWLVLTRLRPHLLCSTNFSLFQSADMIWHSSETVLLDVLYSVYKQVTVLISLDFSAVFHSRAALHRCLDLCCTPSAAASQTVVFTTTSTPMIRMITWYSWYTLPGVPTTQLQTVCSCCVYHPVAEDMKLLCPILDRCLTFH